jgi:hypothetical protein
LQFRYSFHVTENISNTRTRDKLGQLSCLLNPFKETVSYITKKLRITRTVYLIGFAELSRLGGIGCLLQPRLFHLRIQRFIREEFNLLIRFCATRTDPAAETKSIGLPADPAFGEGRRAGALFFARHLDYFIMTKNC